MRPLPVVVSSLPGPKVTPARADASALVTIVQGSGAPARPVGSAVAEALAAVVGVGVAVGAVVGVAAVLAEAVVAAGLDAPGDALPPHAARMRAAPKAA